jgi:predicted PurR-regulated permease PerM
LRASPGQRDFLPFQGILRGLLIGSLILAILLLLTKLQPVVEILFILFAGILLGVFLDGMVKIFTGYTPLSHAWAVGIVLLAFGSILVAIGWLIGHPLVDEMNRLYEHLSQGIQQIHSRLKEMTWLQPLIPETQTLLSNSANVLSGLTGFLSTSLGIVVNGIIILFVGIYLILHPAFYIENGLRILPPAKRERALEVITALGRGLRRWVYGRLATMAIVGVLTAIGLAIVGLDLAIPLGVIAGILAFVPYIGPILSIIPAVLVALAEGSSMVGSVLIVYLIVQTLESYLLTPLIQKQAVAIPPALLISVQVIMGVLVGSVGVMLATPMAVSVIILIQMLYMEDVLDEHVHVIGDP